MSLDIGKMELEEGEIDDEEESVNQGSHPQPENVKGVAGKSQDGGHRRVGGGRGGIASSKSNSRRKDSSRSSVGYRSRVLLGGNNSRRRRTVSASTAFLNRRVASRMDAKPNVEPTYEDLLNKYKQIQLQLKDLSVVEGQKDSVVDKENLRDEDLRTQVRGRRKSFQHCRSYPPKRRDSPRRSVDEAVGKKEASEQAEEDDETELRKLALASAAARNRVARRTSADGGGQTLEGLRDNYEEVSMDLDSSPESPKSKKNAEEGNAPSLDTEPVTEDECPIEEDEDLLRAVLLRGLAEKVSTNRGGKDRSNGSSVVGEETNQKSVVVASSPKGGNSRDLSPKFQRKSNAVSAPTKEHTLPQIRPFVINLEDDSDSEVEPTEPAPQVIDSITSFLKQARESTNERPKETVVAKVNTQSRASMALKVKHCEEALRKQRDEMVEDGKQLQKLKTLIGGRRDVLRLAEMKLKKVTEQMEATKKIVNLHRTFLQRMTVDHKRLSASLQLRKAERQKLETRCALFGKRVYGGGYRLPTAVKVSPGKKKLQSSVIQPAAKRRKVIVHAQANGVNLRPKMSNEDIVREKVRLQKLEQEIAAKLSLLRGRAQKAKEPVPKKKPEAPPKVRSTVPTEDSKDGTSAVAALSEEIKSRIAKLQAENVGRDPFVGFQLAVNTGHDPEFIFQKPVSIRGVGKCSKGSDHNWNARFSCRTYKSPLLHCRSYRFSPYFRIGGNQSINCSTYAHKLQPFNTLCRFDLTGTCNDEKCLWQHRKDYVMTASEVLADIVSYCPRLAGECDGEDCGGAIDGYVKSLLSSSQDKMTLNDLSLLMVGRVNEHLARGPPNYVFTEPRVCVPTKKQMRREPPNETWTVSCKPAGWMKLDTDGERDSRYFEDLDEDLESRLREEPHAVDAWINLADRKLKEGEEERRLDLALNVLSRGLENNRDSVALWSRYLELYSRREDTADLELLTERAAEFAPCLEMRWKYLTNAKDFEKKRAACEDMLAFLRVADLPMEEKSHAVLEVLLYQARLHELTGRYREAVRLMELAIGKNQKKIETVALADETMTSEDRCMAWLSYVHLVEFGRLPAQLFPLTVGGPTRICRKEPFLLPWTRESNSSVESILANFKEALRKCFQRHKLAKVNTAVCLPLYTNLVSLELFRNRHASAIGVCRKLLEAAPTLEELWVILADIYFRMEDFDTVQQVLRESILAVPSSVYLRHVAAKFALSRCDKPAAEDAVATCARDLFQWDTDTEYNCEASHLYRKLLGLPVDLGIVTPRPKDRAMERNDATYLWLNYCILASVSGNRSGEPSEIMELSLTRVPRDRVRVVWSNYIFMRLSEVAVCPESLKQSAFDELWDLVKRGLRSLGPQAEDSFVDRFLESVDPGLHQHLCESVLQLVPRSFAAALRLLRVYYANEDRVNARELCARLLEEYPKCQQLWEIAVHLAYGRGNVAVVRHLYGEAVRALPYSSSLWTNYVVFELTEGETENAGRLTRDCRRFGVQLGGIVDGLFPSER